MHSFGYSHVQLRPEAVWIENTTLNFSNEASMSSKIEETDSSNVKKVKAIRLRDLLDKKVEFLKIDIEGAELECFLISMVVYPKSIIYL